MREDYYWLNDDSRTFLSRDYLKQGQSAEQRIREIAENAEKILGIQGFADKFEHYMKRGFYSLSTPVWVNFGNDRGWPVSCFNSYIEDTMESILSKVGEVGTMSKMGGGTSGHFGALRARGAKISGGGESSGPVHFMELFDKTASVISQGSSRRGSFAAYLPVEHPDIMEFLRIRSDGHPIQEMSIGVTITDEWMQLMLDGDSEKRKVWLSIIRKRYESGYPYILFIDNVNKSAPQVYKDLGLRIFSSNLCSEIMLSSGPTESFVCVLSSLNLEQWDELKDTDAVETLIAFLDAVNEEFVNKTAGVKFMETAHNFAKRQRALGMGVLGWHSYLQRNSVAWESLEAKMLNAEIFRTISERANKASRELADLLGEPEMLKGYNRRNVTTMAIAPTTSSSFILGQVSPSVEPDNSVYFVKKLAKGNFTCKNPYLKELLAKYGKDTAAVWKSILTRGGSVQHLSFLSDHEKNVFKTFGELSQWEVVLQAAQRQKYIDQGQSLNLMVPPKTPPKDVSDLLIEGWKMGIKSFYYQRSANPSQELSRNIMNCTSCEG